MSMSMIQIQFFNPYCCSLPFYLFLTLTLNILILKRLEYDIAELRLGFF